MAAPVTRVSDPSGDSAEALTTRGRIAAIVGASSGNLIEWYDFYTYAFTAVYFAPAFFPSGDRTSQLLASAGIFAFGFFMRPLGSWWFGWLADRHGRRKSMIVSVLMMCAGSLLIGVLPTYARIGAFAPWLLLVARLAQGLSVGGEYGTVATFMSEVAGEHRRSFYASFQYVTLIGGQLLALLVLAAIQQFLAADEIRRWGWRIPFLVGAAGALVAFYLRRSLHETASASTMQRRDAGSLRALLQHRRALGVVLALTAGGSVYFYTFTTYMQKYLVNTAQLKVATVNTTMAWCLAFFMCAQPLFGLLADRIGRRNMLLFFGAIATVTTVPLLTQLGTIGSPAAAFVFAGLGLLIASFYTSISGIVKAELFPAQVRALGVGLPYALAQAVFGGTTEYVALWLKARGHESAFFTYVTALVVVALGAAIAMPETRVHGFLRGPDTGPTRDSSP